MQITNQKRLAAKLLKCGVHRVWINPAYLDQVSSAVQTDDIREFIEEGWIKAKPIKGTFVFVLVHVKNRSVRVDERVTEREQELPTLVIHGKTDGCALYVHNDEFSKNFEMKRQLSHLNTVVTISKQRVVLTVLLLTCALRCQ